MNFDYEPSTTFGEYTFSRPRRSRIRGFIRGWQSPLPCPTALIPPELLFARSRQSLLAILKDPGS